MRPAPAATWRPFARSSLRPLPASRVVALAGPKGSGKGAVAARLVEAHGFTETSFAGEFKALAVRVAERVGVTAEAVSGPSANREAPLSASGWALVELNASLALSDFQRLFRDCPHALPLFGVERAWWRLWDGLERETRAGDPVTVRTVLQRLGTDCGRALWSDVWVSATMTAIGEGAYGDRVVISDARFPNEAATVLAAPGGAVWWVDRPGYEPPHGSHASEPTREVFGNMVSATVLNNGTLEQLSAAVDREARAL